MKNTLLLVILFILVFSLIEGLSYDYFQPPSSRKLKALSNSLDPTSITQHLAFYQLYPNTREGQQALQVAWNLLSQQTTANTLFPLSSTLLPPPSVDALIQCVCKQPGEKPLTLEDESLRIIDQLAAPLKNRQLKGFQATKETEVLELPPEEIDLARGVFISQLGEGEKAWKEIRSYEAMLDLMALQILARASFDASPQGKIRQLNTLIFDEMRFRFPPHSLYAKDVDLYTFLPSVLDSRRGVCLGVSILYLCLAQRIGLPLEVLTPPGHIFVRHAKNGVEKNIETTARGVHLETEEYLGVNTRNIQKRDYKEVIGMIHFNQASVYWISGEHQKAIPAYKKAQQYFPDDMLVKELLAYNYLLTGKQTQGEALLRQVENYLPDDAVVKNDVAEDYLQGATDAKGIQAVFMHVDETRVSILKKQEALQQTLKKYPRFRAGLFHLAVTYLQLHRQSEALETLQRYRQLQDNDPTAEYYLAILYAERLDFNSAWEHLRQSETITYARNHFPKALKMLRKELELRCPEHMPCEHPTRGGLRGNTPV